jgi:hypothetical protein
MASKRLMRRATCPEATMSLMKPNNLSSCDHSSIAGPYESFSDLKAAGMIRDTSRLFSCILRSLNCREQGPLFIDRHEYEVQD